MIFSKLHKHMIEKLNYLNFYKLKSGNCVCLCPDLLFVFNIRGVKQKKINKNKRINPIPIPNPFFFYLL